MKALVAGLVLLASPAAAHTVGVSRGTYQVSGNSVEATLAFSRLELAAGVPGLDGDGDGRLSAEERERGRPALAALLASVEVSVPGGACTSRLEELVATEQDGVGVRLTYTCPTPVRSLSVHFGPAGTLSLGHRHLVSVALPTRTVQAVLYESQPRVDVAVEPQPGTAGVIGPLFRLGVEHILTGYDHLVFLIGLVLVGGRLRPLLLVVTAFTVAHSITLGLAVFGAWAPGPRFVEPAIALSIAYVGVENWFVRDVSRRWLVTFPFGLVHGFGFAGALQDVNLPAAELPKALAAFNVGVEAGQLAVVALVLPLLAWAARRAWFAQRGVKVVSAAIALAGFCWFVARVA